MATIPNLDLYPCERAFEKAVDVLLEWQDDNLTEDEEPEFNRVEFAHFLRDALAIYVDDLLSDFRHLGNHPLLSLVQEEEYRLYRHRHPRVHQPTTISIDPIDAAEEVHQPPAF